MRDIYFSKSEEHFSALVLKKMLTAGSYSLATAIPPLSNMIAEKILCTPYKTKKVKHLDDSFLETSMQVHKKEVKVYMKGDGDKTILFSHGWSGASSNFSAFYDRYIEAGYRVITLDHIAHGKSSGEISNYYYFYKTIEELYNRFSDLNIVGVVAHSLGAAATIGARLPEHVVLCLLSPAIVVFDSLYKNATDAGLSSKMVDSFLSGYEKRYTMNLSDIDPKNIISELPNKIEIHHCVTDKYISVHDNNQFLNSEQLQSVRLLQGLGHFRILKSSDTIERSLEFFNEHV